MVDKFMNEVSDIMHLDKLVRFKTSEQLNSYLETFEDSSRPLAGVIFDVPRNASAWPNDLKVTFRFPGELRDEFITNEQHIMGKNWQTDILLPQLDVGGPRNTHRSDGGHPPGYFPQKFIYLQSVISMHFIKTLTRNSIWPEVYIMRYPYPPVFIDYLLTILRFVVPIIIFLSFLYPCVNNVEVSGSCLF